jgi:hypothetical protein
VTRLAGLFCRFRVLSGRRLRSSVAIKVRAYYAQLLPKSLILCTIVYKEGFILPAVVKIESREKEPVSEAPTVLLILVGLLVCVGLLRVGATVEPAPPSGHRLGLPSVTDERRAVLRRLCCFKPITTPTVAPLATACRSGVVPETSLGYSLAGQAEGQRCSNPAGFTTLISQAVFAPTF